MINNDLPKVARYRKLTEDDHRMYDEKRNRNPSYEELGKKYGLEPSLASRICRAIQRKRKEPKLPYKRPHDAKPVNIEIRHSGHLLTNSQIAALYHDKTYSDVNMSAANALERRWHHEYLEHMNSLRPLSVEIQSAGQSSHGNGSYSLVGWK